MKLKFERFEGLSLLSVRGQIDAHDVQVLKVGLENLMKDLTEPLAINCSIASFDPKISTELQKVKKQTSTLTKQKVFWVTKDRALQDAATPELMVQKLGGSKFRQIGERIKLDDQVFLLHESIKQAEQKLKSHDSSGGGSLDALIRENAKLRGQDRILKKLSSVIHDRMSHPSHETPGTGVVERNLELKAELKKKLEEVGLKGEVKL